ncbi:hypothetical protein V4F39_04555 [Aquincola sp. MAHUQ-54]|uniref:Uncharacterized protein n=1 Tax=Aquincola agrisoli TaxID=3119538 RepID=A0AAW9QAH1_9BURK
MAGLTSLGLVHTLLAVVALAAGLAAFFRDGAIVPGTPLGQVYVWTTVLTCLTGFGIFQRGGFNEAHMLGVLTLAVLALAALAHRGRLFGRAAPYVGTVGMSLTFFFHMIPGLTETFTRVPSGAPLFTGPDDPALQKTVGAFFVLFLVGATLQVRRLRARTAGSRPGPGRTPATPAP